MSTDVDAYYGQWFGASIDKDIKYHNEHNNSCNLPTLIMIRHHKTGGYMKYWEPILIRHCNLRKTHFIMIDDNHCNLTSNSSLKQNEIELKQCHDALFPNTDDGEVWNIVIMHPILRIFIQITQTVYNEKRTAPVYNSRFWSYNPKPHHSELIVLSEKSSNHLIILSKLLDKNPNQSYIPIMMVREPLHTILSGYNYHAQGSETKWTDANLMDGQAQLKRDSLPLIHCFVNIFNRSEYVIDVASTMYREYAKGFENDYNDTNALQYGLYLEFTRFVNCEWPLHFGNYQEIKYNSKYKWFLFLRFEWFHRYNYSQSVEYFMKQLNVSDDALMDDLLKGDLENVRAQKNETILHITKDRYDEEKQINLLLTYSDSVCLYIKKMTLMLDGLWRYHSFC